LAVAVSVLLAAAEVAMAAGAVVLQQNRLFGQTDDRETDDTNQKKGQRATVRCPFSLPVPAERFSSTNFQN
jgi:hypothetical protein